MKNRYVWVSSVAAMATCVSTFAAVRPIANQYGKAPLTFEANAGQTDGRVKYLSRGAGYTLFLTEDNQAVLSLSRVTRQGEKQSAAVRMSMVGSKRAAAIRALEPQATVSNYVQGSDPKKWLTGVKHFGRVAFESVYPGIDAVYYGNQRQLEYDFVVAAGADPSAIRLKFDGAERISMDSNGDLLLHANGGPAVRQLKPVVYQDIDGKRRYVAANYKIHGKETTFSIGEYDRSRELVIDPILTYSGYLGGAGVENGLAVALDTAGNVYVAGSTSSADFPIFTGFGVQNTYRGGIYDAYVVKYGPNGGVILSSTFIGGTGTDEATAIGVDSEGGIVVAGQTDSVDFPLRNPLQAVPGGKFDAFLLKIAASGGLAYSTFIGGFEDDFTFDLAVDSNNNAVVCGSTRSTNFWASGGLIPSFSGGATEGWVFKMNPIGQHIWSTYLGGNGTDSANSVAVDPAGNIYVTGSTSSLNFPVTPGVFQNTLKRTSPTDRSTDAFVTKISAAGSAFVYSTYLGDTNGDEGMAIAVNAAGNAVVTGDTSSLTFPIVGPPLQGPPGNGDTFVTKLNPTGSALVFSQYLAGSAIDNAADIGIDALDNVYVFGSTTSTNFPVDQPMQPTAIGARDLYISKFNPMGSARVWSTYLGGTGGDSAGAMAVAPNGNVYLTGSTTSIDYPRVGVSQSTVAGTQDAFVTLISGCDLTVTPGSATFGPNTSLGSFSVNTTSCTWTATASDPWITITSASTGVNSGVITYTIEPNSGLGRTGFISVSGVNYTITQTGLSNLNPAVVSLTPNSGSGVSQTFTARFSTANPGGATIDRTYLLFNTTINGTASCMVEYSPLTSSFRLINDNGATWSPSVVGGTNATLSNSQCTLTLNGSNGTVAAGIGVVETIVNYAITFNTGFSGLKTAFLLGASESSGLSSGWVSAGSWTVTNTGPITGTIGVQSLQPTTGSGSTGTFTATFTHSGGANSHYLGYMLFLPTPNVVNYNATGTCLIEYNRISNGVRLIDNAGTGWLGPLEGYPVGTPTILTNNYCSVNVQNVIASVNGTVMNVTATVFFQNTLGPVLGTFLQAFDVNGQFTGMTQFGNWVLPTAPQLRSGPAVSSITPTSTTGSAVTYTITSTHTNGWNSLELINLLISDRIVGSPGCHVVYFPGSNTFNLVADHNGLVLPVGVAPGASVVISNSRCSISTAGAGVAIAGNTLTVAIPVNFNTLTFSGGKNVYGNAFGSPGLTSHWVQGATLIVQ